jgi:uncharacterized protein (TIGR00369 family)
MNGQKKLEDYLKASIREDIARQKDSVNSMLEPDFHECNFEEGSITLAFPVLKWETNRIGILHGGATASMFDYSMGILARFYSETRFAPTISIEIKYIRPVELGDTVLVKAQALSVGRKIIHLTVEARSKSTGKMVASGASIFYVNESRS